MMNYTVKIREAAQKLLSEGKVDVVIGYRRGTVPMMNEPILIRQADQAGQLYWDSSVESIWPTIFPNGPSASP